MWATCLVLHPRLPEPQPLHALSPIPATPAWGTPEGPIGAILEGGLLQDLAREAGFIAPFFPKSYFTREVLKLRDT